MQTTNIAYKPGLNETFELGFSALHKKGKWLTQGVQNIFHVFMQPFCSFTHYYGISCFEGMRACMSSDGSIHIFQLDKHYRRFLKSCSAAGIPPVPEDIFILGILQMIKRYRHVFATLELDEYVYIRPGAFASGVQMGLPNNDAFRFTIVMCVGKQSTRDLRACVNTAKEFSGIDGEGSHKIAANYELRYATERTAEKEGYQSVIWTRRDENRPYENPRVVLEFGTMNLFIDCGHLITPTLDGSFLPGINRETAIILGEKYKEPIIETRIALPEFIDMLQRSECMGVYGIGTAAARFVPFYSVSILGKEYKIPSNSQRIHFLNKEMKGAYFGEEIGLTYIV